MASEVTRCLIDAVAGLGDGKVALLRSAPGLVKEAPVCVVPPSSIRRGQLTKSRDKVSVSALIDAIARVVDGKVSLLGGTPSPVEEARVAVVPPVCPTDRAHDIWAMGWTT